MDPELRRALERSAVEAAPALLGAHLTRTGDDGPVTVRITEVEAYEGGDDPGPHAFRGPTPRTRPMFDAAGTVYVYRSYGIHLCLNIVCGVPGVGVGCLVRAGEVVDGLPLARRRRTSAAARGGATPLDRDLARGPGNVGSALGVELADSGRRVDARPFRLEPSRTAVPDTRIVSGLRVGLAAPGGLEPFRYRFRIAGDPTVSAYQAHRTVRDARRILEASSDV